MADDSANRVAVNSALRSIPKLVEASRLGMQAQALKVGEEIALLLDRAMPTVSDRIRKSAAAAGGLKAIATQPPQDLLEYVLPVGGFETVVLPEAVLSESRMVVVEHARAAELALFDTCPRHKIVLHGPPGNGKTMLARAFGIELGLPVFEIKYGNLIASYLGETAKNLQKVFDFVASTPCVLFIDEFDTVGISRSDGHDVGESRRITNQMLLLLDRVGPSCMLIAATNLFGRIDPALARRFDFAIELPAPTEALLRSCVQRELSKEKTPGYDRGDLVEKVVGTAPPHLSAAVDLCRWIRRDLCLTGGVNIEAQLRAPPAATVLQP